MKYEDLREGDVFAIEDIKSYPKIKTHGTGYLDMRDEIRGTDTTVSGRNVELLSAKQIADNSTWGPETEQSVTDWINDIKKRCFITSRN